MSCCGNRRAQLHGMVPSAISAPARIGPALPASAFQTPVYFEYLGTNGITVSGPVTGKAYIFQNHGDKVAVDARDARSVMQVPGLREVRHR